MASLGDLKLSHRAFVHTYRWRKIDPVPFAPLDRPLSDSRVGIVSTAGLVPPDEEPFDESIRGGDWSYRVLDDSVELDSLIESHRSSAWDHTGVAADRNLAIPIDRLHELRDEGVIGPVNRRHLSFMGSLTAPGRLIRFSAPEAAGLFVEDQVDVALFVPV